MSKEEIGPLQVSFKEVVLTFFSLPNFLTFQVLGKISYPGAGEMAQQL